MFWMICRLRILKTSPSKIKKKLSHKFGLLSMNNTTQSLTVIALHKFKKNFWGFSVLRLS
jgi:hypothetical protein